MVDADIDAVSDNTEQMITNAKVIARVTK
jgi:hypothetical protein